MRRFTCWCTSCMHCEGKAISSERERYVRVEGCSADFTDAVLALSDARGVAASRARRHADGESLARTSLKNGPIGTRFATATPPYGYDEAFELFETVAPVRDKPPVEALGAAKTINGIKFTKNRVIVWCRRLGRCEADPDGRTYVQSSEVRAIEARMIRFTGVQLEETGPPCAEDHTSRERRSREGRAAEPPPLRRLVISEAEVSKLIVACDE